MKGALETLKIQFLRKFQMQRFLRRPRQFPPYPTTHHTHAHSIYFLPGCILVHSNIKKELKVNADFPFDGDKKNLNMCLIHVHVLKCINLHYNSQSDDVVLYQFKSISGSYHYQPTPPPNKCLSDFLFFFF